MPWVVVWSVVVIAAVTGVVEIVSGRTVWGLLRGTRGRPENRDPRTARRSGVLLLLAAAHGVALVTVGRADPETGLPWLLVVVAVHVAAVALVAWSMPVPPEYRRSRRPSTVAPQPHDPGAVPRQPPDP